jgi:hypothetical protein
MMPESWRLPTARLLSTAAIAVGLTAAGELDAAAATPAAKNRSRPHFFRGVLSR